MRHTQLNNTDLILTVIQSFQFLKKKSNYGAGKMAHFIKRLPHKHEELNWIPRIPEKGLGRWRELGTPALRKQRQEAHGGLLASQLNRIGEL